MAKAAEDYANMYNLPFLVDPDGCLRPVEKSSAISAHCEQMLSPENWTIYFLHENDPQMVSLR